MRQILQRIDARTGLWAAVGAVGLGLFVALEFAARAYGLEGPLTTLVRETVLPPKSGPLLYAGLALTMVVMTWRQRFIALGTAITIDLGLLLVRWVLGVEVAHGHPFGNGALWVVLGCGVLALTRRTGPERVLLLKGVGLGLVLIAGRKLGDTWLVITAKSRPQVLDPYLAAADHALGNPSWLMGRLVTATGAIGFNFLDTIYGQLAVAAVVVALYQLRNVAVERRFPRHHLVRTFLLIGLLGPAIYMIFPVVGPVFAYGTGTDHWASIALWSPQIPSDGHWAVANLWPETPPPISAPHSIPFDTVTPRNCMPSLHTAWATAIFIHSRKGPRLLRVAGTFWLIATLCATLGFGYHYGVDLIAGVVFTLTIETAVRTYDRGWDPAGLRLTAYGTGIFTALLLSYALLPVQMGENPWLAGPLLLLAMLSVIYGYVRTVARWDTTQVPVRKPQPHPEPA
ncbi:phosphatase PAP2 family protein [Streptomyces griseorubiginosus]|uniref:phosphatase PAP2 family protein n=1 Tax=Streptomyces griseorubiginosus TaxID=67304 RepID=UPI003689D599